MQQKKWSTVKFSSKRRVIIILIGLLAMFMARFIPSPKSANDGVINNVLNGSKLGFIYVLLLVIFGPIIEELIFRFMLIGPNPISNHVKSKKIYWLQIIISSLLFGAWHLHLHSMIIDLSSLSGIINLSLILVNYAIAGFVLACVYAYTQDIRTSIIVHCGSNLIEIIIAVFISVVSNLL